MEVLQKRRMSQKALRRVIVQVSGNHIKLAIARITSLI